MTDELIDIMDEVKEAVTLAESGVKKKATKKAAKKKAVKKTAKKAAAKKIAKKTTTKKAVKKTTKKAVRKTTKKAAEPEEQVVEAPVKTLEPPVEVQEVPAPQTPEPQVVEAPKEKAKEAPRQQRPAASQSKEKRNDRHGGRKSNRRGGKKNHKNFNKNGKKNNRKGQSQNEPSEELPDPVLEPFPEDQPRPRIVLADLHQKSVTELQELAREENISDYAGLDRRHLVFRLMRNHMLRGGEVFVRGVLEILPDGYGFLRSPDYCYLTSPEDIYVSPMQIRSLGLQAGHEIAGPIRATRDAKKFNALAGIEEVNGRDPATIKDIVDFEKLTPTFPERRIFLETTPDELSGRALNLVTPIGFGQRMLIVAPPRTGKTVLLKKISNAITTNHPDATVMILLIDERPEEVTDMERNTDAEVISSTFDESPNRHIQIAEMVLAKARRMVECGKDVVILLDSITRLARAYNTIAPRSGKIMTGGVDASALQEPRRFFGSARAVDEGGSLTVIGTALVDTGSRMDEVIFEEFKGTGNSELCLTRMLVDRRIWPAVDITRSGTRQEDRLLEPAEARLITQLRRVLAEMQPVEAMEMLLAQLQKTQSNAEFLMNLSR